MLSLALSLASVAAVADTYQCDLPWPKIELFLPTSIHKNHRSPRYYELDNVFLRSFLLFWPLEISNVSLTVAHDEETISHHSAIVTCKSVTEIQHIMPGGAKVALLPPSPYYRGNYDRQQLAMFWADNFTDSEYVGFMYTDVAFVTYIDREDLFEEGKPVINARGGYFRTTKDAAHIRTETLGPLKPFKALSYFPVIIKRSHLKDAREYISQRHNLTFDDTFYQKISVLSVGHSYEYSLFDIMFTYLYTFKRSEYKWYIHAGTNDGYRKKRSPVYDEDGNLRIFPDETIVPKPRVSSHLRNRPKNELPNIQTRIEMNIFLRDGVCISPPFPRTESICNPTDIPVLKEGYHIEMHNFEGVDYGKNLTALKHEYSKRNDRIKNCQQNWNQDELNIIMKCRAEMEDSGGWK